MSKLSPVKQETKLKDVGIKPLLRWAGSKKQILIDLEKYWFKEVRYVEPFFGSGSFFFNILPNRAFLSDVNKDLMEVYTVVRDHPKKVFNKLHSFPSGKNEYYQIRSINPSQLGIIERAARFIYLNKNCFNGLYRTNLKGDFNVPYASYGVGGLPALEDFYSISEALKQSILSAVDFRKVFYNVIRKNDFVYIDPPYYIPGERIHNQYGIHKFGAEDLQDLINGLIYIDSIGANFVMSYPENEYTKKIFKGWNIESVSTNRTMSANMSSRKNIRELLISNISLKKSQAVAS